jgi:protein ImuA
MDPVVIPGPQSRAEVVDSLRKLLPRMENSASATATFGFGLAALDSYLPQDGLAVGALHEVQPAAPADQIAAIGFAVALLARAAPNGQIVVVLARRALPHGGRLHGHGLHRLGLDPGRVILVETDDQHQALWAVEEALRSRAPAAVGGAVGKLDLKTSQRLHLAAGEADRPLVLLRGDAEASASATRWRIGAATAARDAFGLIAAWRWRVWLDRCRNGRVGEWMLEYDHASHRFSLAAGMANPALSHRPSALSLQRTGRS